MPPFFGKINFDEKNKVKETDMKQNKQDKIIRDTIKISNDKCVEMTDAENEKNATEFQDEKTEDLELSALERRELIRTNWKNTQLEYDVIKKNGVNVCAMKKIGTSHIRNRMPCQDSFLIKQGKNYSIAVVADGHGNKKHDLSEFGSKIACESLVEVVEECLCKKKQSKLLVGELCSIKFKSALVNHWKSNVKKHFLSKYTESFDEENTYVRYGTTLLFAIDYEETFVVGQLGDGGILLSDGNGYYKRHRNDDKIGSGTSSLCSPNSCMLISVASYSKKNICQVMLMTDGMYDIFGDEKTLYSNFDDFMKHFDGEFNTKYFNEKYNSYVEYISDDTTVALMKSTPIKGKNITEVRNVFTDDKYEIISENRVGYFCEYTIDTKKSTSYMILGDFLPEKKIQPDMSQTTKTQICLPDCYCKHSGYSDRIGLVYGIGDKYITIDEYFETNIKRKSTKSDIELFFKIASNLMNLVDELEGKVEYFDETMFRRMYRFDIVSGECILLWYTENDRKHWQSKCQKHIKQIVVDYLFDFLFSAAWGNINIFDDLEYSLVSEIVKINVTDRISPELSTLFFNMLQGKLVDFEKFKQELILGFRRLVICSNCKRSFIIDNECEMCPHCQQKFKNIGDLIVEDKRLSMYSIPVITGIEYRSNNIGFEELRSIASVIYNEQQDKYGIKNDSGISWSAYNELGASFEVPNGKIKSLDNTRKITIQNKTIVVKLKEDEKNG